MRNILKRIFFIGKPRSKQDFLPLMLLFIFLCLIALHIFVNVDFTINGDKYQVFSFARDIAHGRFYQQPPLIHFFTDVLPIDKELPSGHIGTRYYNGKVFSKVDIGFPLILSGFYLIFGEISFFYACQVFLIAFLLVYYFAIKELLFSHPARSYIALIAVIAVGALPNTILTVTGGQFRDIPALFFLFLGLLFLFKCLKADSPFRPCFFLLSVVAFGISCTIRLTNLVFLLPISLHLMFNLNRRLGFKQIAGWVALAGLAFNISILPSYIQNLKTTGKLFVPPQHAEAETITDISSTEERAEKSVMYYSSVGYLVPKLPKIFSFFIEVYSIPGFIIIAAGIAASFAIWRRGIMLILSPFIVIIFFGMYGKPFWARYMLFSQPFFALLLSLGFFKIVDIIRCMIGKRSADTPYGKMDAAIMILLFAVVLCFTIPPVFRNNQEEQVYNIGFDFFRYSDIDALKSIFEKHIPPGGILLASHRLYENIDFFTNVRSADPYQPLLWQGTNFKFGFNRVLDNNIPLYFIDNRGRRDGRKYIPAIKENFDLIPIDKITAKEIRLRPGDRFRRKECTLYKIEKKKTEETNP